MNKNRKLSHHFSFYVVLLEVLISVTSKALKIDHKCSPAAKIGCVIDYKSRAGKEQKIAIEMAIQDHKLYSESDNCTRLTLLIKDSDGNPGRTTASGIKLIVTENVDAIVGTLTSLEVALIAESTARKPNEKFPIISLTSSPATSNSIFFQMENDVVFHSECMAAVVGHFKWRKVTAIYEHYSNYGFSDELTFLSGSLRMVNSEIEHQTGFPALSHHSDPEKAVEEELQKLKRKSGRVFIVIRFSLPSVLLLFNTAKGMGMMEKGYVWIISDEIASLLDSLDSSFKLHNMQGVIGIKTRFNNTTETNFKQFKRRFRRAYELQYPEEEENSNPSIFALRAYDSITTIAKAVNALQVQKPTTAKKLYEKLFSTDFQGLSGTIRFKNNGVLDQSPRFEIINVDGKSYREIGMWSKQNGLEGMRWVYWPGGTVDKVPIGWGLTEEQKPLRLAIPGHTVFDQFVKTTFDQASNKTIVSGFSINVFEAAVKRLPYPLRYELVPFNGSYDEMVHQIYYKGFDGAVGDIQIFAARFQHVEFTQPYVNSGLEMIVTVEADEAKEIWMFRKVFSQGMWIRLALMHIFVCSVISIIERNHHKDPNSHKPNRAGLLVWICVLLFSQREPLQSNMARLVFAPWMLVILVIMATFTASLSSMLTVSQIRPSVLDIETLKRTNATVACNGNSFIVKYLVNTLNFKRDNVRNISVADDYPMAFERGEIKAAFFVTPHAQVFLAKNCGRFIRSGTIFKLGGFGFAFPKGSRLAIDISEAITEVTESKEVENLETAMLSSLNNCSLISTFNLRSGTIGPEPFSVLFIITAAISGLALFVSLARLVAKNLSQRFRRWAHMYFTHSYMLRTNALPTYRIPHIN